MASGLNLTDRIGDGRKYRTSDMKKHKVPKMGSDIIEEERKAFTTRGTGTFASRNQRQLHFFASNQKSRKCLEVNGGVQRKENV